MTEKGISKLTRGLVQQHPGSLHSGMIKMKESLLGDFDEIQALDRRKAELTSIEKVVIVRGELGRNIKTRILFTLDRLY